MRGAGVSGYRLYEEHSDHRGRFVFTCEHASNRVTRHEVTQPDHKLLNEHWGLDIGAAALVESLCQRTGSTGVLSTESRLVIDVNRDPSSKTLIVSECDGIPVSFNQNITAEDRIWRQSIFDAYHRAVDDVLSQRLDIRPDTKLVSIHSFTPIWKGVRRKMEVGILFDRDPDVASRMAEVLTHHGLDVALNEPYSGLTGELMYAAHRHGNAHQIPYIEFEVRQDLLMDSHRFQDVLTGLLSALETFY